MALDRSSGILLHPTSLPSQYGIGTLGDESRRFVDFLADAGQKLWQILPLGPTGYGDSPYQCFSAFAGNPLLIDLEQLQQENLLTRDELEALPAFPATNVNYTKVAKSKLPLLVKAYDRFSAGAKRAQKRTFSNFCAQEAWWLDDYSLFATLKEAHNEKPWVKWKEWARDRHDEELAHFATKNESRMSFHKFVQFTFFSQWRKLLKYAHSARVRIIGDMPLYVAHDSADVWVERDLFKLLPNGKPKEMAGVPPDYFSRTGQLWGNPIYNWRQHKATGFDWWIRRMRAALELYDIVRIDHFRGLAAYWSVPHGKRTAMNGKWIKAPGRELLQKMRDELGTLPLIAEDLGVITPDVEALRDDFDLPGMKILQFSFDSSEENDYLPHNYLRNAVAYTGTHDNDTMAGWYRSAFASDCALARDYLNTNRSEIPSAAVRAVWASVADMAIAPLQDILSLGSKARMNTPGTIGGDNWRWRFRKEDLSKSLALKLRRLTHVYGR
jgi:4-alpha-glucanotransferase